MSKEDELDRRAAATRVVVTGKEERMRRLAEDVSLLQREGVESSSVLFSIWDMAGQTVFYDMLHILLSP
jgi:hypothetical protein